MQGGISMEQLLTVRQVAQALGKSEPTVRRLAAKFGWLGARKVGGTWGFPKQRVEELLASSPPSTPSLEERILALERRYMRAQSAVMRTMNPTDAQWDEWTAAEDALKAAQAEDK